MDLRGPARVVLPCAGGRHHLYARKRQRFALVERLELGKLFGVLSDQLPNPPEQLAALGGGCRLPASRKSSPSGGHGRVDVSRPSGRERAEQFAGGRVE